MDEDIDEHMDENRTPNLREPNETLREFDCSTSKVRQRSCSGVGRACSGNQADFRSFRSFGTCRAGRSDLRGGKTFSQAT